jgi:hypothetical protein
MQECSLDHPGEMQQGILAAGPVFDVREEQVVNQNGSDHPCDCSKMGQRQP